MKSQLQIKGLKTWTTLDGGGYQFNLYRDGKKVAFVHEAGEGGCLRVDWFDPVAEKDIQDYVKTLPDLKMEDMDIVVKMSVDIFLDDLVAEYEWQKKLAKHRKGAVLFRFLTDPAQSFRALKTPDVAKAVEYLDKKYPNQYVLV